MITISKYNLWWCITLSRCSNQEQVLGQVNGSIPNWHCQRHPATVRLLTCVMLFTAAYKLHEWGVEVEIVWSTPFLFVLMDHCEPLNLAISYIIQASSASIGPMAVLVIRTAQNFKLCIESVQCTLVFQAVEASMKFGLQWTLIGMNRST